ncbi:MAG: sigma-70 family RNA polymerase sigma factor [Bacteroides sp.]|nr:sigma-70 family RNA polymerase sigma factor [Bacteroides sp.]
MKNSYSQKQVAAIYLKYRAGLVHYIQLKINNHYVAEDITQDVFVRLIEYKELLHPDSIHSFVYTIARNLTFDYLRKSYKKREAYQYIYDHIPVSTNESEEKLMADSLVELEQTLLSGMPGQRKRVYQMHRFEERTIPEIADTLQLSKKSVENHLLLGRRRMRAFLKKCM